MSVLELSCEKIGNTILSIGFIPLKDLISDGRYDIQYGKFYKYKEGKTKHIDEINQCFKCIGAKYYKHGKKEFIVVFLKSTYRKIIFTYEDFLNNLELVGNKK